MQPRLRCIYLVCFIVWVILKITKHFIQKQNLNAPDTYAEVVVGLEEVAVLV